jgi:hypothetical protein
MQSDRASTFAAVGFGLLLAFAHPWPVVLLSDLHTLMPEKDRDALNRHARQQEFRCERIPESVRVSVLRLRVIENDFQSTRPVSDGGLLAAFEIH